MWAGLTLTPHFYLIQSLLYKATQQNSAENIVCVIYRVGLCASGRVELHELHDSRHVLSETVKSISGNQSKLNVS